MEIIRAKCPLRVSFCGGGTDFPHYFNEYGGACLTATINKYARVNLYPREDSEIVIRSINLGNKTQFLAGSKPAYDGVLDLCKAAVHELGCKRGMDLVIESDVPPGSGLGGSSSVVSAIMAAVIEYTGQKLTKYEQANLNYYIEREVVQIPGGKQDQFATSFGGINFIEFSRENTLVNPLNIERDTINDLEAHLLFCYTGGVRTDLTLIDDQIQDFQEGKIDAIQGTHTIKEIAYDMKAALLQNSLDSFGAMFHRAFVNKKRVNPNISAGTIVDALYSKAREHGAIGGKLCGAGGGGYLLIFAPIQSHHAIRSSLTEMGGRFDDLQFDGRGPQVWRSNCW